MSDPFSCLSDVADNLWDLYQKTDGDASKQARSMYDKLENDYLEPIRRSKVQDNSEKYGKLTTDLQADISSVNSAIERINKIADDVQKVAQYAAVFDQVTGIAAKLLLA
jgi:N-methylhydantoinase B/oxoprolinase/acetone carboxylase alpha subunit